jgi:hypothetical protein
MTPYTAIFKDGVLSQWKQGFCFDIKFGEENPRFNAYGHQLQFKYDFTI